jgi:hypothetical protein
VRKLLEEIDTRDKELERLRQSEDLILTVQRDQQSRMEILS